MFAAQKYDDKLIKYRTISVARDIVKHDYTNQAYECYMGQKNIKLMDYIKVTNVKWPHFLPVS